MSHNVQNATLPAENWSAGQIKMRHESRGSILKKNDRLI